MRDVEQILCALRWSEDMVIINHDGDRVWLRECYLDGRRVGITDCCLEADPCDWHRAIGNAQSGR